ncbi:unnamed protein product [Cylicostephanus goldi]|uniref:Uncharacterized protein n=1 Tax=Cylicostephanus goldi TaxID=71465 RepID=A0A3P7Q5N6_CYLGO|nr:unnamed protein product [Cylicostephanus goldi]
MPFFRIQDSSTDESELLRSDPEQAGDEESSEHDQSETSDLFWDDEKPHRKETMQEFVGRQYRNVVHFFVEDWFLSALLGIITAILSITTDVGIEYILHCFLLSLAISVIQKMGP